MENGIPLFQKGASYLRIKQGNVVLFIEFNASVIVKQVIILFGAS